jgi:5-bromo-4-chloroindolyl phosphate hydrolysis protein
MSDRACLRAEAERQELDLSEDDLEFIRERLEATRTALAKLRPVKTERLEPPCYFVPSKKSV